MSEKGVVRSAAGPGAKPLSSVRELLGVVKSVRCPLWPTLELKGWESEVTTWAFTPRSCSQNSRMLPQPSRLPLTSHHATNWSRCTKGEWDSSWDLTTPPNRKPSTPCTSLLQAHHAQFLEKFTKILLYHPTHRNTLSMAASPPRDSGQ